MKKTPSARSWRRSIATSCATCAGALERLRDDVGIVVFIDADGSDDPSELPRLLVPIVSGDADLVIGSGRFGRSAASCSIGSE
jgi:hypothetical protein